MEREREKRMQLQHPSFTPSVPTAQPANQSRLVGVDRGRNSELGRNAGLKLRLASSSTFRSILMMTWSLRHVVIVTKSAPSLSLSSLSSLSLSTTHARQKTGTLTCNRVNRRMTLNDPMAPFGTPWHLFRSRSPIRSSEEHKITSLLFVHSIVFGMQVKILDVRIRLYLCRTVHDNNERVRLRVKSALLRSSFDKMSYVLFYPLSIR